MRSDRPANGFRAQAFRSATGRRWPMLAALGLLVSRRTGRRMFERHIEEDAAAVNHDPSLWHHYEINWQPSAVRYSVDDELIFDSTTVPQPPLGLVVWIDNQFAAFDPQGRIAWGLEPLSTNAWLEIEDLRLNLD